MVNRIKIAMLVNKFDINGISVVIMNYCKALDKCKYDLTIIAGIPIAEQYIIEAKKAGIKMISLPSRRNDPIKHYLTLFKVLNNEKYDIVHDHGNSSMMAVELTLAKIAGIKARIAHSHNSVCPNMKLHKILNPYFKKTYTKALACGTLAGEWLFGKNQFEVLPNGFDTYKFVFNEKDRVRIRKELHIENAFVIGHVGRFNKQKNQAYLIEIFEQVAKVRSDAVLLLIGTGPDFDKIKGIVDNSSYKNLIILYGVTEETRAMYSAMDAFALPSKYEGLPVVLLEAQITGLPCIVSDRVTKEVDFGGIQWLPIDDNPESWVKAFSQTAVRSNAQRRDYRREHIAQIECYDISQTVKQLDTIYERLVQ